MATGAEPDSYERRKLRKIVVERRRRERIDRCLEHLRLILQTDASASATTTTSSSNPGFSDGKLEKADILEQTVSYLHLLTQHRAAETARGYAACLQEVDNFLDKEAPLCKGAFRAQLVARLHRQTEVMLVPTTVQLNSENKLDVTSPHVLLDRKRRRRPLQTIENTGFTHGAHLSEVSQGSGSSGRGLYAETVDVIDDGIFSFNHVTKRRCRDGPSFGVSVKRLFPQNDYAKGQIEDTSAGICENQVTPASRRIPRASVVDEGLYSKSISKNDIGCRINSLGRTKLQWRVVTETVSKTETETGSQIEIESEIGDGTDAEIDRSERSLATVCVQGSIAKDQEQEQVAPETEIGMLSVKQDGDQSIDNQRIATPNTTTERGISPGISHGLSQGMSPGISQSILSGISHGNSSGISHGISPDFWKPWQPWTQ